MSLKANAADLVSLVRDAWHQLTLTNPESGPKFIGLLSYMHQTLPTENILVNLFRGQSKRSILVSNQAKHLLSLLCCDARGVAERQGL